MKLTRDRVLLAAGLVCVGAGAVLLFAPRVPGLGPLEPLTDIDTATQVGLLLGLVVAIVAAFQMRRTARDSLDRSGLRSAPPEQPRDATVLRPSGPLANTYQRVSDRIGRSGRSGWHVVAYGRRARYTEDATTRRPDSQAAPLRPPGAAPEPGADRTRRPATHQDGGQPLREDRRYRAGNHSTGDRAPPAGADGRRATEPRRSATEGRRPTESEENGRQPVRETAEPPEGPGTGQQVTEHREPKMEEQQQRAGPQDMVDSDRGGRAAWEQRPTATQFRQRSREQLLELLDDVAETAQDTYATATGCDPVTAERAVAAGEWTNDRVAAAFLATDRDAPEFTLTERAAAWLGPQRTLERRLAQTLDAVERHADSYLTYERGAGEGSQTAGGGEQA